MKRLFLFAIILPLGLWGQEITIAGKQGSKSGWTLKLDPASFIWIANPDGSLTLKIPSNQSQPKKFIGQILPRGTDGTYAIPVGAKNIEIWVNGLHYWDITDFTISGSILTPKPGVGNWSVDADVRINYEVVGGS